MICDALSFYLFSFAGGILVVLAERGKRGNGKKKINDTVTVAIQIPLCISLVVKTVRRVIFFFFFSLLGKTLVNVLFAPVFAIPFVKRVFVKYICSV